MKLKDFKNAKFVFSSIFLVFGIYLFSLLYSIWPIDTKTISQAGVFGDSFGVLTALFSALAFGGLIITIWQQQEELNINRDEIRSQHFENILFRMLEVHNEIVRDLDLKRTDSSLQIASGRDCFTTWHNELKRNYDSNSKSNEEERLEDSYKVFWSKWNKDLGHYFRFLYNIFKHIDQSTVEDKKLYTNIIRAQISDYELSVLFYNCLYKHGSEKFKPLIEKYALFDNLPEDLLFNEKHKARYKATAFGE